MTVPSEASTTLQIPFEWCPCRWSHADKQKEKDNRLSSEPLKCYWDIDSEINSGVVQIIWFCAIIMYYFLLKENI